MTDEIMAPTRPANAAGFPSSAVEQRQGVSTSGQLDGKESSSFAQAGRQEQEATSGQDGLPEQQQSKDIVTIVLTANNHLGSTSFAQQPRKHEEQQQRLRRAFEQAVDFAIGQRVDFFVQAGDLFDTITPPERDRSFVATRLAQLRQAGVAAFAVGGVHDTPSETHSSRAEAASAEDTHTPPPQLSSAPTRPANAAGFPSSAAEQRHGVSTSGQLDGKESSSFAQAGRQEYAHLGALHYFAPDAHELEPVFITVRNVLVGICGLGVLAGQEGNPLAHMHVHSEIERATIPILLLHAPIEGLDTGSSLFDTPAHVSQSSIEQQTTFRYILAGYHHSYRHLCIGKTDVIVAGASAASDGSNPDAQAGFVFLGLGPDGLLWCKHIALVIDDGERDILTVERFSPREELLALADEWIAAASDEGERKALYATKEELVAAMDEVE